MIKLYQAPDEKMKAFLVDSLEQLTGFEKLSSQDLSKLLIEKGSGRKLGYNTNKVSDFFPWLHKIGVIDFEKQYHSGWRLYLFRKCGISQVEDLIMSSGDVEPENIPKKTVKKKCCDNPRPVRSKKTGIGKCKSCGARLERKTGALASKCCANPRPVKSKKTGKRRCKNCGKKLAKKNS